jgi:putative ABC transport system substrate-binding protein
MRRRQFIAGLGSAVAWPMVARAQQPATPVIGYLSAQSADDDYKDVTVPFLQGLKETGYVEGQNVAVEYRYAENRFDATFSEQRVGAVFVGISTFFNRRKEQLAALSARYALPAMFPLREFALAGGLISYGTSLGYVVHQSGIYTGRILKGDKPVDLPVQQITKIDLVINLKTAKALGLTIPETLLATADEVIQ